MPFLPSAAELIDALPCGAMCELWLTPKPGLVDRHDPGAHLDLTFGRMAQSIGLLPEYFAQLYQARQKEQGWPAYIALGRNAEARMLSQVGTNAHRGFIFLGGLVLLAACKPCPTLLELRQEVAVQAQTFFDQSSAARPSHGQRVRARYGLGTIEQEACLGLPSVFALGLPGFLKDYERERDWERAGFFLMSRLMQAVQDSTAVHRCGRAGLERLRQDGALLEARLGRGEDPRGMLFRCNAQYRALGLTMGGVADCMALTFGLFLWLSHQRAKTR